MSYHYLFPEEKETEIVKMMMFLTRIFPSNVKDFPKMKNLIRDLNLTEDQSELLNV